jgi:hypothetical protein
MHSSKAIDLDFKTAHRPTTLADFTYQITPNTISITDTGKTSVTNDIEAVLRKVEYWHQGSITGSRSCIGMRTESGDVLLGMVNIRRSSR